MDCSLQHYCIIACLLSPFTYTHTHSPVWRQEELSRINATTSGPERKAALCALLEQEAQLIASIGRHRLEAGKQNKEDQMKKFLDAVSDRCVFCVISN